MTDSNTVDKPFQQWGQQALNIEQEALASIAAKLDHHFDAVCNAILACQGRVIVTGIGKSGHIARKIAATLASTGTPAYFVHPAEASHGDLGMITAADIVLGLSYSGETQELICLLPVIKRIGAQLIGLSRNPDSTLARYSNEHLTIEIEREACPLNLAPTSSTTAMLALGDALAIALLQARNFSAEDFALSHPGGSLGKQLLLTLADLMHTGDNVPVVSEDDSLQKALEQMSHKGLGMTAIVNAQQQLTGLFTDGDLRRLLEHPLDIHQTKIRDVMNKHPLTATPTMLAAEALHMMETKRINGLLIVDEDKHPVGAMNMHDLLRAGVL